MHGENVMSDYCAGVLQKDLMYQHLPLLVAGPEVYREELEDPEGLEVHRGELEDPEGLEVHREEPEV